jgi:beta-lactamase class A
MIPVFIAGLLVGYLMKGNQIENLDGSNGSLIGTNGKLEIHQGGYKFINPLLECEVAEGKINDLMYSFENELFLLGEQIKKGGKVSEVATYFRDLNNGPWCGTNEEEKFLPASLLKVPLMMAYYKAAESDPGILGKRIVYDEDKYRLTELKVSAIPPARELEPGKEYTIEELIEAAIIYSDNRALPPLYQNIPDQYISDIYKVLGLSPDLYKKPDGTVSVLSYASFFRILYNASYLSKEYSEKALQLLSKIDYKGGLRAGIPAGIAIARKFGEGGYLGMEKQLHDCGIIYHPRKPYLLCVMTRGDNIQNLQIVIQDISKYVYEQVNKNTQSLR